MHEVIMVIGEYPDYVLEDFSNYLEVPSYKDDQFNIDDMIKHYMKEFTEMGMEVKNDVEFLKLLLPKIYDWCSCEGEIVNGELIAYTNRNPNGKYDWYEFGGRWLGSLKIKQGTPEKDYHLSSGGLSPLHDADQAFKKDIDFEGMKKDAEKRYIDNWNEHLQLTEMKDPSYNSYYKFGIKNLDTKESYIKRESEWFPSAIVRDGDWKELGDHDQYLKELSSIKDDDIITVVDIHF